MLLLRLAWRNLWRHSRRTGIVLAAVAIGIGGVVLSMAFNNGMVLQMVETAISTELGHLQVHARGFEENPLLRLRLVDGARDTVTALEREPQVTAWSRRVRGEGLASSPRANVGVRVVGIEPEREARVSVLDDSVVDGRFLADRERRVLLGEGLAERLHVDVGSKLVLSVQELGGDLTGEAYRVGGVFRTASGELNRGTVFLPLQESQRLFGLDADVSEVVVVVGEGDDLERVRGELEAQLGQSLSVRTWQELRPQVAQMVEVFDQTAWYVYAAVFVAMVFGIANVLLMSVFERTREIGILVSLGFRPAPLVGMIVLEAVLLTAIGLALGYVAAVGAVWALADGIDLRQFAAGLEWMGVGTRIVPVIRRLDVVVPLAVALVTAVVAALWPAWRAARLRPAQAVRQA